MQYIKVNTWIMHITRINCCVASLQYSVGIVGSRFWRRKRYFGGRKNKTIKQDLVTQNPDICSYGMTCYEVLLGQILFEN